ncbi:hypothetical protein [Spirochaeta africana]|uniref:hypothetical protein n=1 Tax=Spirochaeta africana TaxID=46355 RepID=UPI00030E3477|nr:hypothetical protein [Spirochaeta africana]
MIRKVVRKTSLHERENHDLEYWLQWDPAERVAAVDYLREQYYGRTERLQRVARVIQRSRSSPADRARSPEQPDPG